MSDSVAYIENCSPTSILLQASSLAMTLCRVTVRISAFFCSISAHNTPLHRLLAPNGVDGNVDDSMPAVK